MRSTELEDCKSANGILYADYYCIPKKEQRVSSVAGEVAEWRARAIVIVWIEYNYVDENAGNRQ
jgi:hypothetical protein